MNRFLRVLPAAAWLLGLLPLAVEWRERAQPAPAPLFACDAGQTLLADFDDNGVIDEVASEHVGAEGAALRLVINGRQQILVGTKTACRIGVGDVDEDSDIDLVALNRQGDLQIWRNDRGTFRSINPRSDSSPSVFRAGTCLEPAQGGLTLLTFTRLGFLDSPAQGEVTPTQAHAHVGPAGWDQSVWVDPQFARPPPIALVL